jgi:uncharacterized coiled-coil protein SlyX
MPPIEDELNDFESRINELERRVAVLENTIELHCKYTKETETKTDRALEKAETEMNRRLLGMNEFREQLNMQTKSFITYDTYNANHKILEVKIEAIQKIVWGGLAVIAFLAFAIPLIIKFIQ